MYDLYSTIMQFSAVLLCLWAAAAQSAVLGRHSRRMVLVFLDYLHVSTAPLPRAADAASTNFDAVVLDQSMRPRAATDGYWLNDLSGKGIAPFNPNPAAYKVFRNVKDYGAKGQSFAAWTKS